MLYCSNLMYQINGLGWILPIFFSFFPSFQRSKKIRFIARYKSRSLYQYKLQWYTATRKTVASLPFFLNSRHWTSTHNLQFFQMRKAFKRIFWKKYLDIVGNNVRYQFQGKYIVRIFPRFRNILSFIVRDYEKPKFLELGQEFCMELVDKVPYLWTLQIVQIVEFVFSRPI